jgi:hypothetical protein
MISILFLFLGIAKIGVWGKFYKRKLNNLKKINGKILKG